jgi:Ca2+-binding EF-hand superfamily protein
MRAWCIPLTVAALACCQLPALAQNKEKDVAKAAALQAEVMKKVMAKFDLNGDGNVDEEEKSKVVEQFTKDIDDGKIPEGFNAVLDKNKNGKLEPQEAAAFQAIIGRLKAGAGGPPQFGPGNAAGGGAPGFGGPGFGGAGGGDAFSGQVPPEILKKFDKNKDGQLDDKEKKAALAALGPKKSRAERLLQEQDLNGDGKVTKEERAQVAAQRKAEAEEKKAAAEEKKKARKKDDKDPDDKDAKDEKDVKEDKDADDKDAKDEKEGKDEKENKDEK